MEERQAIDLIEGLVAKIDGADLNEDEQRLLDMVLDRAASAEGAEVEGFLVIDVIHAGFAAQLSSEASRWASAAGVVIRGGSGNDPITIDEDIRT